jgi:aerobic carbon-monoxide dehydrogenase large subunit
VTADANISPAVGRPVPRTEDERLLTGRGRFVADTHRPGTWHAAFVRSPVAKAAIRTVDIGAALALPGVKAAFYDAEFLSTDRPAWQSLAGPGSRLPFRPLAGDSVRFVGDPIVIVVAQSRYIAEDACDLIEIDYEQSEAVVDFCTAYLPGSPLVHPEFDRNVLAAATLFSPDIDLEEFFDRADHVVIGNILQNRYVASPMECRGIVASWDPHLAELEVIVSTQSVHESRSFLARYLGLPEHTIRVIAGDVGGAFGQKMFLGREEVATVLASRALGVPVQWLEDRHENLVAATHSRLESARVRLAIDRRGTMTAMTVEQNADIGAYPVVAAGMYTTHVTGPYRIPLVSVSTQTTFTNTMGRGAYRAPGMFETTAREIMVDRAARQLGLDPVDFRRQNMLRASDLPYQSASGSVIEDVTPLESLDQAVAHVDYQRLRATQTELRRQGRYMGIGICAQLAAFAKATPTYASEGIMVRIEPDGNVSVYPGTGSQGQGLETTTAQVISDTLGVSMNDVKVFGTDSQYTPYGGGTGGSRSGVLVAGAASAAGAQLRDRVFAIASDQLEVATEDLEIRDGIVSVKGTPEAALSLAAIARIAYIEPYRLAPGLTAGLEVTVRYVATRYPTWSNSTHICVVEVDVSTGQTTVLRYVVSEDCGPMINPMIVDGQIFGGVLQGIGGALYENFVYDDVGNPLTTTFMDYLLPTAPEAPTIEVLHLTTPSSTNEGGFKGVAESGAIGSHAAVVNAVADALSPFGVEFDSTAISPPIVLKLLGRSV